MYQKKSPISQRKYNTLFLFYILQKKRGFTSSWVITDPLKRNPKQQTTTQPEKQQLSHYQPLLKADFFARRAFCSCFRPFLFFFFLQYVFQLVAEPPPPSLTVITANRRSNQQPGRTSLAHHSPEQEGA